MLQIKIFNVEHGNCAYIVMPNGETILIDAGHSSTNTLYPRHEITADLHLRDRNQVTMFINSNADQDHVSDLNDVVKDLKPKILCKNPTIDSQLIRSLKPAPLTQGLEALCTMCDTYNQPVDLPDFGGVKFKTFHNPFHECGDTNNASQTTFLFYGKFGIVFPGDLEEKGWKQILQNVEFRDALGRVNYFVSSHHGRETGYHADVFTYCKPNVIIISDKSIEHETQEHGSYQQHAKGIILDGLLRKVISTRNDGAILIRSNSLGEATCLLGAEQVYLT